MQGGADGVAISAPTPAGVCVYIVDTIGLAQRRADGLGNPREIRVSSRPPAASSSSLPQQQPAAGAHAARCGWEVLTDVGWAPYTSEDAKRINDAMAAGAAEIRLRVTTFGGEVTEYTIDLASSPQLPLLQRRADGTGRARPLRAVAGDNREAAAAPLPRPSAPPAAGVAPNADDDDGAAGADGPGAAAAASPWPAAIPDELLCPITREVLRDPVVAADGFTYGKCPSHASVVLLVSFSL
jgi:hypothetical protein